MWRYEGWNMEDTKARQTVTKAKFVRVLTDFVERYKYEDETKALGNGRFGDLESTMLWDHHALGPPVMTEIKTPDYDFDNDIDNDIGIQNSQILMPEISQIMRTEIENLLDRVENTSSATIEQCNDLRRAMYKPGDMQTAVRTAWETNRTRGLSDDKLIGRMLLVLG